MFELLGNPWFGAAAFVLGPLVILFLARRRRTLEDGVARRGTPAKAAASGPAAAPSAASPARASATSLPRAGSLPSGFRDLAWGSAPVVGMVPVHETGDHRLLSRPADVLKVGNVLVSSIVYVYQKERLAAAMIELPVSGFDPLVRHLKAEWGTPKAWKQDVRFSWADLKSGEEGTQAVLEKRAESRTARLVVSSKAMAAGKEKVPAGP